MLHEELAQAVLVFSVNGVRNLSVGVSGTVFMLIDLSFVRYHLKKSPSKHKKN